MPNPEPHRSSCRRDGRTAAAGTATPLDTSHVPTPPGKPVRSSFHRIPEHILEVSEKREVTNSLFQTP